MSFNAFKSFEPFVKIVPVSGGAYDSDAAAWFAAIVANGSTISTTNKNAANAFVLGCKADGIWSLMGCVYLFAGPDSLAGSFTPLKGPTPTNNNFTASEYHRTDGVLGVIANLTSLDTNYNASNVGPNDHHAAVYSTAASFANNRSVISAGGFGLGIHLSYRTTAFRTKSGSSTFTDTTVTPAAGFRSVRRDNSSDYKLNFNGVDTTITDTTTAGSFADDFHIWAGFTPVQHHCADRLAFASMGLGVGMSMVALRSRVLTYISAIA